jgi:hypothetical protein
MEFMPSRFFLGLRVANSVKGITLNTKLRSESESEEEMYSMYSMLPISVGIVPRIWKGAGRCGNVDASGRSGTVYTNNIETLGTTLVNNQAEPSLSLWLGLRLAVWAFWEAWIASLVILEAWLAVGLVACSFCSKKIAVVCTID